MVVAWQWLPWKLCILVVHGNRTLTGEMKVRLYEQQMFVHYNQNYAHDSA